MFYPHHTHVASRMTVLHPSNPYYKQQVGPYFNPPVDLPVQPPASPPSSSSPPQPQRSQSYTPTSSTGPQPRKPPAYRTRSVGGPFGIIFEREIDLSPPNDDEIIIATVRLTNSFRRASLGQEGADTLPERPQKRGFLRRMSTRWQGERDSNRYTAIKLPRKEYKKYFARDKDGNYAGTEEEREWTAEDLEREFGMYQDMPLRSIPGSSEYGEGDRSQPKQDALLRVGNEDGWHEEQMVVGNDGEVKGLRRVDGLYLL